MTILEILKDQNVNILLTHHLIFLRRLLVFLKENLRD